MYPLTTSASKLSRSHRKHLCASLEGMSAFARGGPTNTHPGHPGLADLRGPMLSADPSPAERDRDFFPSGSQ